VRSTRAGLLSVLLAAIVLPGIAWGQGATLVDGFGGPAGFGIDSIPRADDGSQPVSVDPAHPNFNAALAVAFPNGFNFYGVVYRTLHINNNGSISFAGPLLELRTTPFPRPAGGVPPNRPQIAPFLADVDTRGVRPGVDNRIYFAVDAANRRLVITWNQVGYFEQRNNLLNTFQVILTARDDLAPGDFDIDYLYNRCEWSAGERETSDINGVPRPAADVIHARVGFDAANGVDFAELAPLSGTARVLELCSLSNAGTPGGWTFPARGGDVFVCGNGVEEPGEECDEANVNLRFRSGDGCSSDCRRRSTSTATASTRSSTARPMASSRPAMTTAPARCRSTAQSSTTSRRARATRPTTRSSSTATVTVSATPATTTTTTTPSSMSTTTARRRPTAPTIPALTSSTTTRMVASTRPAKRRSSTTTAIDKGDLCDIDSDNDGVTDYVTRATPTRAMSTTAASPSTPTRPTPTAMASVTPVIPTPTTTVSLDCGDDGICDPDDDGYDNDRDGTCRRRQ
jgi:cysteine-rich repeat protein